MHVIGWQVNVLLSINACENNPCGANTICSDIPGATDTRDGRTCACKSGYHNFVEGSGCSDINSCTNNPCSAHASCTDIAAAADSIAGRTCTCHSGYENYVEGKGCSAFVNLDAASNKQLKV